MPRRGAEHRDQRRRLEAAQEGRVIARVHDEPVGDEQQVEPPPLGDPGDLLDHRQIVVAGGGTRVAPAGGVVPGAEDENAEMHLTRGLAHSARPPDRIMRMLNQRAYDSYTHAAL